LKNKDNHFIQNPPDSSVQIRKVKINLLEIRTKTLRLALRDGARRLMKKYPTYSPGFKGKIKGISVSFSRISSETKAFLLANTPSSTLNFSRN